jgi:hypothetical protein
LGGLCCAALGQFLALIVAGAGHGWNAPLTFSLALFLLFPAALVAQVDQEASSFVAEMAMLGVGIGLDLLLLVNILGTESSYFQTAMRTAGLFPILWLGLWIAWQVLVALSLWRRLRPDENA